MNTSPLKFAAITVLTGMILLFQACGLNKETRSLRALQSCTYQLAGVDRVDLAGVDIKAIILDANQGRLNIAAIPAIALGYLTGQLPLTATFQLEIKNPTAHLAGVGQFEYIILLDNEELLAGTSDLPISVPAQRTVIHPMRIQTNIYPLLSKSNNLDRALDFLSGRASPGDEVLDFTFKLKPTLTLAGKPIQYPGYITVRKSLDATSLRQMLERNSH